MAELSGRRALVTGSSRGIGRAIAIELAARGATVACVARTLKEGDAPLAGSLETTVAEIRAAGGQAIAIGANIADEQECHRAVAEAGDAFGPVDLLVNNAAFAWFGPAADVPITRWRRVLDVNLTAPLALAQAVIPGMVAHRWGAIINISSGAARGPGRGPYATATPGIAGATTYGVSKAALDRLTQGLAEELAPHGVIVAAVGPSQVVMTPGTAHHGYQPEATEPAEYMARAVALIAAGSLEQWTGRVLYSQRVLEECGELDRTAGPREAYLPRMGD